MDDKEQASFEDLDDHESTSKETKEPKNTDENQVYIESQIVKSFQKLNQDNVGPAKETKLTIDNKSEETRDVNIYEPGPSRVHLPGAIYPSPKLNLHTRLSKSEHSIPQLITATDVANALKLTSISFGTNNTNVPAVTNLNLKDLKIPIESDAEKVDSNTLIDVKKFVANCFKFTREDNNINVIKDPVTNVATVNDVQVQNANPSCHTVVTVDNNAVQPKDVINKPQIDTKGSKDGSKKKNGSLSERSDIVLGQRDSLSSIGSNVCRICMTRGRERLISPCNCKGSMANVHLSCLERWLNQVGRNHCELCGFSYPAIRTPRYTVLQALRLWFGNPRNRSHLQSDCLIFWLLSTVTAGLLAVCIVGTQYFVIEGNKFGKLDAGARKEEGISHRVTETAMDFFMAIVLCGYSVTVYLLWKDHYVMWNRWRRANVNVRLLLSRDADPVPFVPRPQRYNV